MPLFGSIKRKDLIRYLKDLGFEGPYSGGKHQFMIKEDLVLRIPNPRQADIGRHRFGVTWKNTSPSGD